MRTDIYNILVADDEIELVDSLKHFLSSKGFNVNGVLNGEDALKYIDQHKTDLLLLDLRMPGMHGKEVARLVKERHPDTKILVITAYAEESKEMKPLMESMLKKPFRLEDLHKKLLNTLVAQEATSRQPTEEAESLLCARTLLIKATILFMEPSLYLYNFLQKHFKALALRGEYYELKHASNYDEVKEIFAAVHPDIFLVNTAFFKETDLKAFYSILASDVYRREIITYKIRTVEGIADEDTNQLIRQVETFCLMNGLVDIQWRKV